MKVKEDESAPNPFVLFTPYPSKGEYKAGDELVFDITLFGIACRFEQQVIDASVLMNQGKLVNTQLIKCEQIYSHEWSDAGAEYIPHCEVLHIHFLTPAAILAEKQAVTQLDFSMFIDRLFWRIGAIIDKYGEDEFVLPYRLVSNKPYVKAECDLRKVSFQTSGQPILAVCGSIRYCGDVTRYLPYIDLGSQLHIGKKTTRSCGAYCFEF